MKRRVKLGPRPGGLVPRRAVKPATARDSGALTATPAQVMAAADEMSTLESQLGGVAAGSDPAGAVEVVYDDQARDAGVRLARVLETEPAVATETGVTPARLDARTGQYGEAHKLRLTLEDTAGEIDETLQVVGRRERRGQQALVRVAKAHLASLPHGSDEWRAFKSDAADLLEWDQKRREKARERAAATQVEHAAQAQAQDQAGTRKKRTQVMHDMQAGKPVSAADESDVLDAYGEMEDDE